MKAGTGSNSTGTLNATWRRGRWFDGKPKQRLVEFVMGKETRIEAVDDGTYVVTPRLNPDGSVRYAIILESKDTVNGVVQTRTTTLSDIIQTPWAGFALAIDNGAVMAFDPDND